MNSPPSPAAADVISTGTYETPLLEEQGIDTATFGQFNMNKDVLITADPSYQTASDLPEGCRIATESVTGNTIIWASLINELDGRELAEGSDDLGIVTADYQVIPTLIQEGEACAGIIDPTQVIPAMASGDLTVMYDGKSASQLYGENIVPGHEGVLSNAFVSRRLVRRQPRGGGLLPRSMGLRHGPVGRAPRRDHRHLPAALRGGRRVAGAVHEGLLRQYVRLVRREPYLTEEWIEGERPVFDLVQQAGIVEDAEFPRHETLEPPMTLPALKAPDRIG